MADETECRVGYAFNNPNLSANDGFGEIISADELRYVYAFGLPLVAPNGATYTNDVLNWYVDNAIGKLEQDLSFHLMPRRFRARPRSANDPRTDIPDDEDFLWDDPYDYRLNDYHHFMYIKLRHRPIRGTSIIKASIADPMGNMVLDVTDWAKPNFHTGSVEFYPSGSLGNLPLFAGSTFPFIVPGIIRGYRDYPDAISVDYDTGFDSAEDIRKQHRDLFGVIGMLSAINLLNDYGDGRTAALASSSVGLSGLSESFSTTLSATNAMFGARILQFEKQIKAWYDLNRTKYRGVLFAAG